ncbi:carboxymuconolactone decarboxylase family protein [Sphingomonas sp.]|jgi:4-carboxymuconolactone decarboxylase|uniref:carboxymuconolactone decarboxylase family protein n=1 Tax=Sphingomonas sp. TaxID=28214 RepID=UPI002DE33D2F|nr:carboxymuconolactone decarboxylase family protein [Sphingomonas sp.]
MNERYLRGVEILQRLHGNPLEKVTNAVAEIAPDFARMTIEFPFGDLYARGGADLRTREIAAVSALAAIGAQPQLRVHIKAALRTGCSREELIEILMQVSIYAGFPAALNALAGCHDLLAMPPRAKAAE